MLSLFAGWRVSLRRTRADWPIVAAAWLITLLAAVLLSTGPIYSSAASVAGLRRALADAPVADTNIGVSLYASPDQAAAADPRVRAELRQAIEPLGGTIVRDARDTDTFALPNRPAADIQDRALLGSLDGLPSHATLTAGAWPVAAGPSVPIQVAVLDAVAKRLDVVVGADLRLTARRFDETKVLPVRLVGTYTIDRITDPFWRADAQLTTGVQQNASIRTFGPFLTTPSDLLKRAGLDQIHVQWTTFPNLQQLTLEDSAQLRDRLEVLPKRLEIAALQTVQVRTGLPAILGDAERSLLVSKASVLLLMIQLAILAAYAIILTASLLVDHRRIDTALLRSRGAGPWQVGVLSLAEGLLVAIPAVLLAPWVAVAALGLLNVVGPLADAHLDIVPQVTIDGYVAAGAAGVVCVLLLALPALLAARTFATEQRELSRQETRTFGQRMGIDIALLAASGIALWQLRLYGAPLTRTVQGSLGLDPLLVAAPAIGLLAGVVLALRVLPHIAQATETVVSRGRDLVASLGARQLARRPLRYTRSALLLMIAMSTGVFALSYASTWSSSQRDQAAFQSGADVRVVPGGAYSGLPAWALPNAYAGVRGVEQASPVERIPNGITVAADSGDLLAIDADVAAGIVLFRADESRTPFAGLMQALRAGRPAPRLVTLPEGTTFLRITPRLDITSVSQFNPFNGEYAEHAIDPSTLRGIRISVSAVVRDGRGLLYQVDSGQVELNGSPTAVVLPLEPSDVRTARAVAQVGAHLDGPIELAALGVALFLPAETIMNRGTVGLSDVSAGADHAGPWTQTSLASAGSWTAKLPSEGRASPAADLPADLTHGVATEVTGGDSGFTIFGNGPSIPSAQLAFQPNAVVDLRGSVPVIANQAFLDATATAPGDTVTVTVEGVAQNLSIAGAVDAFPATDPARPVLVLDEPTLGLMRLAATNSAKSPSEWWIATADGNDEATAASLRADPFASASVLSVTERIRSLSTDPVALGIIGALTLGFVATGLFAIVGLTVSAAVSARQRRTEFALLRALGLSGRQLSAWLWLENGSLVIVSLLAGTVLGLLVGWLVLPFVAVTQQAAAPIPPVILAVPWDRILLLDLVSAMALGVAVVVIGSVLHRLGVGSILRMGED